MLADGTYEQTSEVIAAHYGGSTPNGNKAPRIDQFAFKDNQNQWPGGQVAFYNFFKQLTTKHEFFVCSKNFCEKDNF